MSPVQRQREKERASSTTAGTIDLRGAETWHQRRGEWEGARRGAFNVAAWTKAELSEGETEEKLRAAVCFHERWPDSLYAYYLLFLLDSLTISCWCATSLKPRHMNTCADWAIATASLLLNDPFKLLWFCHFSFLWSYSRSSWPINPALLFFPSAPGWLEPLLTLDKHSSLWTLPSAGKHALETQTQTHQPHTNTQWKASVIKWLCTQKRNGRHSEQHLVPMQYPERSSQIFGLDAETFHGRITADTPLTAMNLLSAVYAGEREGRLFPAYMTEWLSLCMPAWAGPAVSRLSFHKCGSSRFLTVPWTLPPPASVSPSHSTDSAISS